MAKAQKIWTVRPGPVNSDGPRVTVSFGPMDRPTSMTIHQATTLRNDLDRAIAKARESFKALKASTPPE